MYIQISEKGLLIRNQDIQDKYNIFFSFSSDIDKKRQDLKAQSEV